MRDRVESWLPWVVWFYFRVAVWGCKQFIYRASVQSRFWRMIYLSDFKEGESLGASNPSVGPPGEWSGWTADPARPHVGRTRQWFLRGQSRRQSARWSRKWMRDWTGGRLSRLAIQSCQLSRSERGNPPHIATLRSNLRSSSQCLAILNPATVTLSGIPEPSTTWSDRRKGLKAFSHRVTWSVIESMDIIKEAQMSPSLTTVVLSVLELLHATTIVRSWSKFWPWREIIIANAASAIQHQCVCSERLDGDARRCSLLRGGTCGQATDASDRSTSVNCLLGSKVWRMTHSGVQNHNRLSGRQMMVQFQ